MIKKSDIIIIAIAVMLILIFVSFAAYVNLRKKAYEPKNYNGFVFNYAGTHWVTQVLSKNNELFSVYFRFLPSEVEKIPVTGTLKNFTFKTGYTLFDPYDQNLSLVGLGAAELGISLGSIFNANFSQALCTKPYETEGQCLGVMTCESTNESVILIRSAKTTEIIYQDNHCIILQGQGWGILKSVDKFLYMLYGIIK